MIWSSTEHENRRIAEYMGWTITETFLYNDKRGQAQYEYLARRGEAVIKSSSWSYIKKRLYVQQLNLFD